MNLKSGGGKAEQVGLEAACRACGMEPMALGPGGNLVQLAETAVDAGADVIGMAGATGRRPWSPGWPPAAWKPTSIIVADYGQSRVVAITPDGTLARFAGTGTLGYSGDGGPAIDASIGQPLSLALTRNAVYFTDAQTTAVRRVDLATGVIETVPQLAGAYEIAAGPDGSIYASMLASGSTMGFGNTIIVLAPDGQTRPVAGTGATGFSGDGGPATAATFDRPLALAVDAAGSLFVSDAGNHRIRRIGPDGVITTIVGTGVEGLDGDGGPATAASIVFPRGLGVDGNGGLCIADTGGGVVRLVAGAAAPTPLPATVAPTPLPETGSSLYLLPVAGTLLATGSILLAARHVSALRAGGIARHRS